MLRKNLYIFFLVLAGILICNPVLSTAQGVAKYAGEFLAIGVGARAQGLGSSFVAIADDATAAYWNPAGLHQVEYPQITLMHAEQFAGEVNYDFAGIVFPYRSNTTFGISMIRLGIDGIPDTRNALIDTVQANGRIDDGERLRLDRISYFSNSDYAVYFSVSRQKNDRIGFGGNVKLISRRFGDYSAWGVGFDAAAFARVGNNLTLGANLMDATTTILVWDTGTKELISPLMKVGAAYRWAPRFMPVVFRPVVDLDVRFEGREYAAQYNIGPVSFDTHFGIEAEILERVSFRTGRDDIRQVSFGIGVRLPRLNVDYSYTRFNDLYELGNSHRISLILAIEEETFRRR